MNYIKKGSLILLFLGIQLLTAQSATERLEKAYQSQTALKYEEAIQEYESLMEQGFYSSDLYFNTAMAYYNQENLGNAILYLEKAVRLSPYDETVNTNLKLLQNEQIDALLPLPKFFLKAWWDNFAARLSPNIWGVLAVLSSFLTAVLLTLWVLKKIKKGRKKQILAVPFFLLLAIMFFFLGNSRANTLAIDNEAVILSLELSLYIAPGEDAEVDSKIHAGLKVDVLDQFEDWMKIRLVDGREGWVKLDGVGVI